MFEKLRELKKEYDELQEKLTLPEIIQNQDKLREYSKKHGELQLVVAKYEEYLKLEDQHTQARTLFENETGELKDLAEEELETLTASMDALKKDIKSLLLPKDPSDRKNIIMEIRAGTGGEEAALFCAELFRMYSRYSETRGWKIDIYDSNKTGLGGFREIIFSVEGKNVYASLKWEKGVHRVQRVPETETSGRLHTSACSVAVLAHADNVEMKINKDDLRIDTYRASGKGGQHVNVTDSAVRITHIPTGVVVQCQDERSQMQNKLKAMKVLRARIKEKMDEDQMEKKSAARKKQVGSGDRSEKIRTYNFPQNRVTDHRVNLTIYNLESLIQGNIGDFISELNLMMTERLIGDDAGK